MDVQDIARKIAAIISKADSTAHPEEAAAFMAKAHQMLERYGIDLMDLGRLNESDPVGVDYEAVKVARSYPWALPLAHQLGRYYGVRTVYTEVYGSDTIIACAGRLSARTTFQLMWPYVLRQVQNFARIAYNEGHYKSRMKAVAAMADAMTYRLSRLAADRQPARGSTTTQNALVPMDEIKQVLEEAFPSLRSARRRKLSADSRAHELAEKISLDSQVGGRGQRQITS